MDKSTNLVPRTIYDEISFLRARLALLVGHFNESGEWGTGLKAQIALVSVDDITGGDADFDAGWDP
jgi:hypothetical protein